MKIQFYSDKVRLPGQAPGVLRQAETAPFEALANAGGALQKAGGQFAGIATDYQESLRRATYETEMARASAKFDRDAAAFLQDFQANGDNIDPATGKPNYLSYSDRLKEFSENWRKENKDIFTFSEAERDFFNRFEGAAASLEIKARDVSEKMHIMTLGTEEERLMAIQLEEGDYGGARETADRMTRNNLKYEAWGKLKKDDITRAEALRNFRSTALQKGFEEGRAHVLSAENLLYTNWDGENRRLSPADQEAVLRELQDERAQNIIRENAEIEALLSQKLLSYQKAGGALRESDIWRDLEKGDLSKFKDRKNVSTFASAWIDAVRRRNELLDKNTEENVAKSDPKVFDEVHRKLLIMRATGTPTLERYALLNQFSQNLAAPDLQKMLSIAQDEAPADPDVKNAHAILEEHFKNVNKKESVISLADQQKFKERIAEEIVSRKYDKKGNINLNTLLGPDEVRKLSENMVGIINGETLKKSSGLFNLFKTPGQLKKENIFGFLENIQDGRLAGMTEAPEVGDAYRETSEYLRQDLAAAIGVETDAVIPLREKDTGQIVLKDSRDVKRPFLYTAVTQDGDILWFRKTIDPETRTWGKYMPIQRIKPQESDKSGMEQAAYDPFEWWAQYGGNQ